MTSSFDAVIIGGGIIGISSAYHLCEHGIRPLVLDESYFGSGSTSRCIGGIRQQFSTEASIRLMQESVRQFQQMEDLFEFSVEFFQGGYLFLAYTAEHLSAFRRVSAFQKKLGVNVQMLEAEECRKIVPHLNPQDLLGGVYSPDDGQAYPFKVLEGYIKMVKRLGGELRPFCRVTDILLEGNRTTGVRLENGETIHAPVVVNCAGPGASEVARMAGVEIPVAPEEHEAFITSRLDKMFDTMIVDYRPDGCYFQQLLTGQIIGCYTPVPNKPGLETVSSLEFLLEMSRRTVRLMPVLKHAQVLRHWGGSYCMTPDGSPIIDKTAIEGFFIAAGMSGHGFMFSPAVGRFISDIIVDDRYPFKWDEFALDRAFSSKEVMK